MKEFAKQVKWQFLILARNNIISISFLVTLIYVLIFFGIKNLGNTDKLLTLFILNDPAIIGLFFMGVAVIIERRQQVLSALFVTPVNHHIYILSRVVALSLIGLICAVGMALSAVGWELNWLHFSVGVFGLCMMCCLFGLYLACLTSEFLKMLLMSIPVLLLVINVPLLNYFDITDVRFFDFMPAQGSIFLLDNAHQESPVSSELVFGYISMAIWTSLIYLGVYQTFMKKIVNA